MIRMIRLSSDAVYAGDSALAIVEQMRQADFDPSPTVRGYIEKAVGRASDFFGVTMRLDVHQGAEAELAERFLAETIAHGFGWEEPVS